MSVTLAVVVRLLLLLVMLVVMVLLHGVEQIVISLVVLHLALLQTEFLELVVVAVVLLDQEQRVRVEQV
jgi:hypothetical protein